ncbi:MAG: acyl-CoA dehydrogenase [Oscillatoriales cyanobacterium]|nr:MAG: acyl-CoA dehydrogenase [Oscillatoriales cyanobacterium]
MVNQDKDWVSGSEAIKPPAGGIEGIDAIAAQLLDTIAPQAQQLDSDPVALAAAMDWLGDRGWLAMKVPSIWGGRGASELEYGQFREALARCSGALAFLQAQHQSAAASIAKGENEALKQTYLPPIAQGKTRLGIAFSHLRRSQCPITAQAVAGGWEITGTAPWVTGLGHFAEAVLAVPIAGADRVLFCIVPIAPTEHCHSRIQPGQLMTLGAMNSTQTATVEFDHWLVPTDYTIGIKPGDWIQKIDRQNVLQGSFFALGCTQAVLDRLVSLFREKRSVAIAAVHDHLSHRLQQLRHAIYQAMDATSSLDVYEQKLQLRSQAIGLMSRAVQVGLIAEGGSANLTSSVAQRLLRESTIFATSGQTPEILAATLSEISDMSLEFQGIQFHNSAIN